MLTRAELLRLRSLREKKHREVLGLFVIEGEKVVAELLAAGFPLREIFATGRWARPTNALPKGTHFCEISPAEMARVSHFSTPSPVFAIGAMQRPALASGALNHGLTLALDGVQDPGNVGTSIRIADWFGFARVVLSADCADVFHQKVINASMGSFARVPTHMGELAVMLSAVTPGIPILGCDLSGTDVRQLARRSDAVIVIGSEGRGLSPAVAARVTQRITIPRRGKAESLNAAVAAGIVCAQLAPITGP